MKKTNILRTTGRAAMALAFWVAQAAMGGTPSVTTGGDAEWTEESAGCWRSGDIEDDQFSWIEFAVDDAPCGVSFRWKTSSEDGYDKLCCYLDGTETVSPISGEMDDWEAGFLLVAESGSHEIRFEYAKDSSDSAGDDCGWVKDFAVSAVSVRTLVLDANGGTVDLPGITVADGYAVGALPDAVWSGDGCFQFLGWYTEKDGGEQVTSDSICQEGWTTLFARWREMHPPANDNFAAAATISGATGSVEGSTIDSSREADDLIPERYGSSCRSTVWYQWTAPEDGAYAFTVADADGERGWSGAVGVTTGHDEEEGAWCDADVNWQRATVQATRGGTYWIEVGSYAGQEFDFTLSWAKLNTPANDNFAAAATISGATGNVGGSTIDSTREAADLLPDMSSSSYDSTVWYQWTAPEDGTYAFTVADADGEQWKSAAVGVTTGYDDGEETWSGAVVNWRRVGVQAIKGVTYWIEVGNFSEDEFDFTLSWAKLNPPANDNFAGAAPISGTTGSVEGTTVDSTMESNDLIPDRYGYSYGCTVWYQWTAPEDGAYAFTVADTDVERRWGAPLGVTWGYDEEEGAWSGAAVDWQRIAVQAIKGVTYWIEVGGEAGNEFDFTLSWAKLNPPANDNFAGAAAISGDSGSVEGTTVDSTREAADLLPDRYYTTHASTVWYQWTAPEDGSYVFTVADADEERGWSAAVGVTTGYDEEAEIWSGAVVYRKRITLQATKGVTYWIEVGSESDKEFDFTLSWRAVTPPANDNFAGAIEIEGISGSTEGSNLGASVEEGEPLPLEVEGGWKFGTTASVWWRWKAPEDGAFTVSTEGSDFDTVLGVYTGTAVGSLATVAANDQSGVDSTSLATFGATKGTVYYFAVGGYESHAGDIVLSWKREDDTHDVVVDVGGGKTVTVPGTWLAANTTRAATDMAANGRLLVWQCYVLGLDPEGLEDFRIVSFPLNADGTPDWEHIGVHPDPATWNVPAMLQLKGAATLAGPWIVVPGVGGAACRFFATGVVLP